MTDASPLTDTDLIDRARRGDLKALDEVVRRWSPRVRRFASRLCPATEVLDAVQESMLVLSSRIGTLRSSEALISWSFQIVKRHCIKVMARVTRETALARNLGPLTDVPDHLPADREPLLAELARVVAQLPPRDREILVLRDLEELSSAEAAVRLGLTEAAMKSRLHRARSLLRRRMMASPLAHGVNRQATRVLSS